MGEEGGKKRNKERESGMEKQANRKGEKEGGEMRRI